MTVRELKERLKGIDDDRLVVLSRDGEGNGYSPLADVDDNAKYADRDIGLERLTAELIESGFSDEDVMGGGQRAVVFWPV
jgi:hypothetical protein